MDQSHHGAPDEIPVNQTTPPALYKIVLFLILAFLVALILYRGLPAIIAGKSLPVNLVVYGFSTQEEIFSSDIFPAFEEKWEAKTGRDLIIEGVFGPSGKLANEILLGAPADVAVLSNAQHVNWLRVGRLIEADTPARVIGGTPIVIVTRPGNPHGIREFADLSGSGLRLLHPEPGQSGAGDWALLAEYGSAYLVNGDPAAAEEQLKAIWNNVRVLASSARATMNLFELGAGDAMVTYEQDALLARDRGVPLEIVVPSSTIIAEHLVVVIDANTTRPERTAAEDFVRYLVSDTGQQVMDQHHLRTAVTVTAGSDTIAQPFTVADLGGWSPAYQKLIEGTWKNEIAPQLRQEPIPRLSGNGD